MMSSIFIPLACKKKSEVATIPTSADQGKKSDDIEKNDSGSPLQRREVRNGDLQGELNPPRVEDFVSTDTALFPPEANGEYEILCEDKIAGANLREDRAFLVAPKDGTSYMNRVYVWIEDNKFAITFSGSTGAKCADAGAATTFISSSQFIVQCNVSRAADQSIVCKTKRAIYSSMEPREYEKLNKMHFCGFAGWQEGKTYDVTGRDCNQGYTEYFADGSSSSANFYFNGIKPLDITQMLAMEWSPDSNQLLYYKPGASVRSGVKKIRAGDGRRSFFFTTFNAIFTTSR